MIDPAADPQWLSFLGTTEDASIFHHPVWLTVLSDTYGYTPVCLIATDNGRAAGVLPLMEVRSWLTGQRAVCLPFSDACGPLVRDQAALRALFERADELRRERRWGYVEIRNSVVPDGFSPSAQFKRHVAGLHRDSGVMLQTFNEHARRKLRKAETSGVRVAHRTDDEALHAFIRLNALTRRKHGVLPQPDSLFRSIRKHLLEPGLGFLGVGTLDGRIVATNLFLHWKDTVVYKYGASDDRASASGASYAVMWDAMRWACEHGFTRFDFGRTDVTAEGLLQFKRGWGSRETDLVYARRSDSTSTIRNAEPGLQARLRPLISRMPVPVLKLIGARAYPHVG